MWKEFKEFAFKGNVLDLAVAVVINDPGGHGRRDSHNPGGGNSLWKLHKEHSRLPYNSLLDLHCHKAHKQGEQEKGRSAGASSRASTSPRGRKASCRNQRPSEISEINEVCKRIKYQYSKSAQLDLSRGAL